MKNRARRSRISFFFSCLFATSTLFAQPTVDTTTSAYLDFRQFSTIAPADQLGFLDKLKWAGMIFVNAPAARRVVSLYDYTKTDILDADCSSARIRNHHALLVVPETHLQDGNGSSQTQSEDQEPEFKWREFSFSNSCELQELVKNPDKDNLHWRSIDDPKLRSIIHSVSDSDAQKGRIIVAERFFQESTQFRQYFAECQPSSELPLADGLLCDTAP